MIETLKCIANDCLWERDVVMALIELAISDRLRQLELDERLLTGWLKAVSESDYRFVVPMRETDDAITGRPPKMDGLVYHGTGGDWLGLPMPVADKNEVGDPYWPTALFVSPFLWSAAWFTQSGPRSRVWVGAVDRSKFLVVDATGPEYDDSIEATTTAVDLHRESIRSQRIIGMEPPAYRGYKEDEGQLLVFDPFSVAWLDVLADGVSARWLREVTESGAPGMENWRDWVEQADRVAAELDPLVSVSTLVNDDWVAETRSRMDVVKAIEYPAMEYARDFTFS